MSDLATLVNTLTEEQAAALRTELVLARDARVMRGSFEAFVRGAWATLEPGRELLWNWHLSVVCAYLEAVHDGRIRRLIVNIPPGSMKSLLVSVLFPAWKWIHEPSCRFLCGSNEGTLATRDALRMRSLVESTWFNDRWPHVQLSADQREKTLFQNTGRGHRESQGVLAKITGKRGDCVAEGTLVATEIGDVEIERLHAMRPYPRVWSVREDGVVELQDVVASRRIASRETVIVSAYTGERLQCTPDHLVWVGGGYEKAERIAGRTMSVLRRADKCAYSISETIVRSVDPSGSGPKPVYDIQVAGNHNFFANGILVHNCIIWDDPHDTRQTDSDAMRQQVIDAWDMAWSSRMNDPDKSAAIIIMQRIHQKDITGHLLAKRDQEWVQLAIPMRYDPDMTYDAAKDIGRPDLADPRTEAGELLFPGRYSERAVRELESDLGPYGAAGQLQQRPSPKGGGELRREWIMRYRNKPSRGNKIILVDPAGERKPGVGKRDNSAMGLFLVAEDGNTYLIDAYRDRLNLVERADILFDWHREHKPLAVGYERYGMQTDVAHMRERMEREQYRFKIIELGGSMAKEDRIRRLIPMLADGRLWFPEHLYRTNSDGQTVDIIDRFIEEEYLPFPVGSRDDFLDMVSRITDPELITKAVAPRRAPTMTIRAHTASDPCVGY
jgi:hypothetical protein